VSNVKDRSHPVDMSDRPPNVVQGTYDSITYLRLKITVDDPIPYGALHWIMVAEYVINLPQFSAWRNKKQG
jgi:hypothetical protein